MTLNSTSHETTTLQEIMGNYRPPESGSKKHVIVEFSRELAKQILVENHDIENFSIDAAQASIVDKPLLDFISDHLVKIVDQLEEANTPVTLNELVRNTPDGIGRILAEKVRDGLLEAHQASTSSTTDSI